MRVISVNRRFFRKREREHYYLYWRAVLVEIELMNKFASTQLNSQQLVRLNLLLRKSDRLRKILMLLQRDF